MFSTRRLFQFLDKLFLLFFVVHIPTTLFFDSQVLFPSRVYPSFALNTVEHYVRDLGDPFMRQPSPAWFSGLVWTEIVLQLPFFFVAVYAFWKKCNWIRIPAIVYGSFVVSTMVPILAELLHVDASKDGYAFNREALIALYAPFLVVPLLLVLRMAVASDGPFPARESIHKAKAS